MGGVGIHSPKVTCAHMLKGLWVKLWEGKRLDEIGRVGVPITYFFKFFTLFLFYVHWCFVCIHVFVRVSDLGIVVTGNCELPYGCWELNPQVLWKCSKCS